MVRPSDHLRTLESLRPGDAARVVDVAGAGAFRRRLLDMGFVRGALVRVIRNAPLSNPVEYCIGRTHVTLRRQEAHHIIVAPFTAGPPHGGRHGPGRGIHGRRARRAGRGGVPRRAPWWRKERSE